MRRIAVLLLLLPLVMAPKIAWDLQGLTADVTQRESVTADRPFPVIITVRNVSGVVQSDAVIGVTFQVGAPGEAYELVAASSACSATVTGAWCELGDMAAGDRTTLHLLAVGGESGTLDVLLTREIEI